MDDTLAESIGQLSTNAKEWKPGQSYVPSTTSSSSSIGGGGVRAVSGGSSSGGETPSQNSSSTPMSPVPTRKPSPSLRPSPPGRITSSSSSSSTAGEWRPQQVREFVPGGGWGRTTTTTSTTEYHHANDATGQQANIATPYYNNNQHTAPSMMTGGGIDNATSNNSGYEGTTMTSPMSSTPYVTHNLNPVQQQQWGMNTLQHEEMTPNIPTTVPTNPPSLSTRTRTAQSWRRHRNLSLLSLREMDPDDPRHKAVPPSYIRAFPLDNDFNNGESNDSNTSRDKRSSFGYPAQLFQVTSREDDNLYCLRRFDNVRCVSHQILQTVYDAWRNAMDQTTHKAVLEHPNIVKLHRCFISHRSAVFFVHAYYPGAVTLKDKLLERQQQYGRRNLPHSIPMTEAFIWSCVTQLVSAMRVVHASNMACRCLKLNRILCMPTAGSGFDVDEAANRGGGGTKMRFRLNCIGIVDALEFEARKRLPDLRAEDMRCLGRIILSLATGTDMTDVTATTGEEDDEKTFRQCDVFLSQSYSHELRNLVASLLITSAERPHPPSIFDVCTVLANRVFDELDCSNETMDDLDSCLSVEYESSRALSLLLQLGFVNERPEFGVDNRWSETGDCYVLKLFRDYVFHQADEAGRPVMDIGHVVTALNKLDAADNERIVLASRDGSSLLVVSYADVARCLRNAYDELCEGSSNYVARRRQLRNH